MITALARLGVCKLPSCPRAWPRWYCRRHWSTVFDAPADRRAHCRAAKRAGLNARPAAWRTLENPDRIAESGRGFFWHTLPVMHRTISAAQVAGLELVKTWRRTTLQIKNGHA
jgi:hypothetical protein